VCWFCRVLEPGLKTALRACGTPSTVLDVSSEEALGMASGRGMWVIVTAGVLVGGVLSGCSTSESPGGEASVAEDISVAVGTGEFTDVAGDDDPATNTIVGFKATAPTNDEALSALPPSPRMPPMWWPVVPGRRSRTPSWMRSKRPRTTRLPSDRMPSSSSRPARMNDRMRLHATIRVIVRMGIE